MLAENINNWVSSHEGILRLSVFAGLMLSLIILESLFPRKARTQKRPHRWFTNIMIVVIDSVLLRLIFPIIAVGTAIWAQQKGWGLFNLLDAPLWAELILAIIMLDGLIYLQHVMSHHIPMLLSLIHI